MEINTAIYGNTRSYFDEEKIDKNSRYLSWEHCYSYFQNLFIAKNEIELRALHLAFYLASWGMYRGSSKLLQKDYKVHIPIVEILLKNKYEVLLNIDFLDKTIIKGIQSAVFDLIREIRACYELNGVSGTDTLVTKVLLGTYGCIPAYDTLLYAGMKYWNNEVRNKNENKIIQSFGKSSYFSIIEFISKNKDELLRTQEYINQNSIQYPMMKLVDMYFWNIGYQIL